MFHPVEVGGGGQGGHLWVFCHVEVTDRVLDRDVGEEGQGREGRGEEGRDGKAGQGLGGQVGGVMGSRESRMVERQGRVIYIVCVN